MRLRLSGECWGSGEWECLGWGRWWLLEVEEAEIEGEVMVEDGEKFFYGYGRYEKPSVLFPSREANVAILR